jgi:hypothetical protein
LGHFYKMIREHYMNRYNSTTVFSFFLLLSFIVVITGCSGGSNAGAQASQTGEGNMISLPIRLAIGTLSLEKAGQGVDAKQAKELLPLWKAVVSLVKSDNTAPQELSALYKQIQDTMTPDQMRSINAVSRDDMRSIAQQTGLTLPGGGGQPGSQGGGQRRTQTPGGGGFPGGGPGGFPGGPGGPGGPEGTTRSQGRGTSANQQTSPFAMAVYDMVIKLLESKIR